MTTLQIRFTDREERRRVQDRLRAIALSLGYMNTVGAAAGRGNLSDLLRAIAAGELTIERRSPKRWRDLGIP